MNFPEDIKYTKDHEWIRMQGDTGVVGITEYAQGELGDVVFVDLPAVGKKVKQHESLGTIEAVKAVSDIFSPVSCEVLETNPLLQKTPEIVNKEPYAGGWMVKIKITNPTELNGLLDAKAYRGLIGQ